jgi:hypothetical protein
MDSTIRFCLSLSIIPAVIIGIVRYRRINTSYYPFIYNVFLVLIIEIVGQILMQQGNGRMFTTLLNIFSILDFCLFTWLFHNWGLFNRRKDVFVAILSLFAIIWVVITLVFNKIYIPNFYFRLFYSFVLIFFSVSTFNKVVVHERGRISRNPKFLICLGIIIFYTFFVIVCATNLTVLRQSVTRLFRASMQEINVYSNLLVNILYAVAIVWIPRKQNFMTPFSS